MTGSTSLLSKYNKFTYSDSSCEDFFCLDNLQKLIKLWEDEQIFAKTFCELLYSYLRPRIESARSKL